MSHDVIYELLRTVTKVRWLLETEALAELHANLWQSWLPQTER
jgi:hypothetical protein